MFALLMAAAVLSAPACTACDLNTYKRILLETERDRLERPLHLDDKDLLVLHSDNLGLVLREARRLFKLRHKDYEIYLEGIGGSSGAGTRSETEPADLIVLGDSWPARELLLPDKAGWYLAFATDEVVLAYSGEGRNFTRLRSASYSEILTSTEFAGGVCKPGADPSGIHGKLMLNIAGSMMPVRPRPPVLAADTVNDLIRAVLEDRIDYAILDRSMAVYHRMKIKRLPPTMNLSSTSHDDGYARASITLSDPGGTVLQRTGEPIVCVFTIPFSARRRKAARLFADFLLGDYGQAAQRVGGLEPIKGGFPVFSKEGRVR